MHIKLGNYTSVPICRESAFPPENKTKPEYTQTLKAAAKHRRGTDAEPAPPPLCGRYLQNRGAFELEKFLHFGIEGFGVVGADAGSRAQFCKLRKRRVV